MTSANFIWSFVIPYELWPHDTSADKPHVTLAFLLRPQQPFCDLSYPLVTFNNLIGPKLNSNYLSWPHRTSCDLTLPIGTSNTLSRPLMTSADLLWPHLTLLNPLKPLPYVTSCNIIWKDVASCTVISCDLSQPRDLSHPHGTSAALRWPWLSSCDLNLGHMTSVELIWP